MNPRAQALANRLAAHGRHGDTVVAHVSPQQVAMLLAAGGSGTRNPRDRLPEFWNPSGGGDFGMGSGNFGGSDDSNPNDFSVGMTGLPSVGGDQQQAAATPDYTAQPLDITPQNQPLDIRPENQPPSVIQGTYPQAPSPVMAAVTMPNQIQGPPQVQPGWSQLQGPATLPGMTLPGMPARTAGIGGVQMPIGSRMLGGY